MEKKSLVHFLGLALQWAGQTPIICIPWCTTPAANTADFIVEGGEVLNNWAGDIITHGPRVGWGAGSSNGTRLGHFNSVQFSIVDDVDPDLVPEPATMLLLGTGLVNVAGASRRKKKNQA